MKLKDTSKFETNRIVVPDDTFLLKSTTDLIKNYSKPFYDEKPIKRDFIELDSDEKNLVNNFRTVTPFKPNLINY